ncbi:hypothetical protein OSB04_018034 [Centaurea solstitialis]|uniref:NB-ARC domain-containing protein n=1 Tax=Centaurea solstitialis TaxID=347529 RepID=A0AA38T5P8_9ASTR|nr:hypothetical protein OSB04_018034 [Centaurea solstitialis]
MLMDDLKKIIHGNHHLLINNNPLIIFKRPQFQLLYQELDSIIQTLSNIHHHHHHYHPDELEKVIDLKKRFKDVVEEAQDSIDLFLSALHFRYGRLSRMSAVFKTSLDLFLSSLHFRNRGLSSRSDVLKTSLDLNKILKSIESIKVELNTINIGNMKIDSSSRIDQVKSRQSVAAGTSYTRNPLGIKKQSEDIVVGLDRDAEIIRDKLFEDTKQLCVVSIVGMGGQGKTTLATKLFNDPFLKYHFHIRAWATVSQTYVKRDLLIQILTSIGVQDDLEKDDDSKLREKLHKKLMGRRYLIVIDDIWSIEDWDELKMFFPNDNTSSRILLTSRLNEVALHVKPHGCVHSLPSLTEEESWELLKQKVFHGNECPEWLIEPGRQIARKCYGLPLSVVVMAGVLAEEPMNKDLWENIACSYIVGDQKGCLESLALSYHHLPDHLRECFLYLGGFPEDFKFKVERLTWLWVAEGFIEEDGNRSLEDTAKAYLMDLINRNLVIVERRNVMGDVKACKLHDLVRELCLQKAKEEEFFLKIDSPTSSSQLLGGITYEQRRIFMSQPVRILNIPHSPTPTTRSLLCFHENLFSSVFIARSFVLLRVLNMDDCPLHVFPQGLALLVHLRYLAIRFFGEFPKSICNLWSLETLILRKSPFGSMRLPHSIIDLVNLRHLWGNSLLCFSYIEKPMNLHSISKMMFEYGGGNVQKCFPNIRKLVLHGERYFQTHTKYLELLPYLENLKLRDPELGYGHIAFPVTLKKLSLRGCASPWIHMSMIQLLPNLEVLKLQGGFFKKGTGRDFFKTGTGREWDACEQQFPQLKFLMLNHFDIKQWKAASTSFPCLKQLSVSYCKHLEEIPFEIGEIITLELIEIEDCSNSVVESVKRIQQEQQDVGNDELKITIDGMDLSLYLSQSAGSESE